MNQADPNMKASDLYRKLLEHKPGEAYTFKLIAARVLPSLAVLKNIEATADLGFDELASRIPASLLQECVTPKGEWASWLVEANPELRVVRSLANDYRRSFNRCLKHAVASGLVSRSTIGVSPAWQSVRQELAQLLPYTIKALTALLDQGIIEFHGHLLTAKTPEATSKFFRTVLDSTNQLGRYMTSLGINSPQEVRPEHLHGTDESWYAEYRRKVPTGMTGVTRSRYGWAILRALHPEWNLAEWPRPSEGWSFALKDEDCPPLAQAMLREVLADDALSDSSRVNIEVNLNRLLGWLKYTRGHDLDALCSSLAAPPDLGWLLVGGFPTTNQGREPQPDDELALIFSDPQYREEVLARIGRANHLHEAQGPCRPNPIVKLYLDWTLNRQRTGSAEVFLKCFKIVGQHYLRINDTQFAWLKRLQQRNQKIKAANPPSARAERKAKVALDRDLWIKLVGARPRMSTYTEEMRLEMTRATNPESVSYWKMRYAVAVRSELMMAFLLCFQLRSRNLLQMKLGVDLHPREYRIDVPDYRAKAKKRIVKNFPDSGPFADLKTLLDTYIEEARPLLLGDRPGTPYLFLAARKGADTLDEDGNLTVAKDRLRVSLQTAIDRHFKDLLPPGLDLLSPHTFRHAFVNFAYGHEGGEILAAQGLSNTAEVVRSSYLGLTRGQDREVKGFMENLDLAKVQPSGGKAARRTALKKRMQTILSQAGATQILNDILKAYDQVG